MDKITIKGAKEGLTIHVKGNNLEAIKEDLSGKLRNAISFFKGAKVLGVIGDELSDENRLELLLLLKYKYDLEIDIIGIKGLETKQKIEDLQVPVGVTKEGMTVFVHGTLRSGQEIAYNGNIVVIGDVNPGAVLKAKGNIIVLGLLKGVAQAGIGGNNSAVVAAYSLLPTQLRIGDIIVRPPEGDTQYSLPEVARVENGEVVLEPYLPNK